MSKIPELASGAITAVDTIAIELVEADETPAVVIVRWPAKPTILHPRRFPQEERGTGDVHLRPLRRKLGSLRESIMKVVG
jgi:hypothetical protein